MSSRVLAVLPVACLLLLAGLAPTASAQDLDHIGMRPFVSDPKSHIVTALVTFARVSAWAAL